MTMYISMAVTVLSLVAMLGARFFGLGDYGLVFKMIASTGFIAACIGAGGLETNYGRAVLVGLFFGWWGDLFLGLPGGWFIYGLVVFLLGHIAYCVAFGIYGLNLNWTLAGAAIVVAAVIGVSIWLGDATGNLRYPVYAYMLVISAMVALSIGARGNGPSWWLVIGAVLFYVSDLFVARQRFVAPGGINGLIGLPLYFAGQLVLAYTCKLVR